MKRLFLIGSEAFAAEVARYVLESSAAEEWAVEAFLALPDDEVVAKGHPILSLAEHAFDPCSGYVVAVSEPQKRLDVIRSFVEGRHVLLPNIVHSTARVERSQLRGNGNVVGPFCYVGVNATLGSLNVLNAFCSVGHHSHIGDNSFFASGVHLGNSARIGNDNFFGIGVLAAHGVEVGSRNRVQAGTVLLEPVADGKLVVMSANVRHVALYGQRARE